MKSWRPNYFQLLNSFLGEVYFRISKNHGLFISEVIRRFYNHDWDIIMLMRRYGEEIKIEQRQIKEAEKRAKEAKRNKRRMRRRKTW